MPQVNAICKICGKPYTHCTDAARIGSWRAVCCSPECWNKWVDNIHARMKKRDADSQIIQNDGPQDSGSIEDAPADVVIEAED